MTKTKQTQAGQDMSSLDALILQSKVDAQQPTRRSLRRWLLLGVVGVVNVLLLAFFGAYWRNEPLSIAAVISILGSAFGIALGLLGILFFFISEQLNRRTSENLEFIRTTASDLRVELWRMIQQIFDRFLIPNTTQQEEDLRSLIDDLKSKVDQVPDLEATIGDLEGRLAEVETQREAFQSVPSAPVVPTISPPYPSENSLKALTRKLKAAEGTEFKVSILVAFRALFGADDESTIPVEVGIELIMAMARRDYLRTVKEEVDGEEKTLLAPGPNFN